MTIDTALTQRANSRCELCSSTENLASYHIPESPEETDSKEILVCQTCHANIEEPNQLDANHWRCLNDSMWSEHTPVQVVAWRVLNSLNQDWAKDLQSQMYMDSSVLSWASALQSDSSREIIIKDSNGTRLSEGDSVTLIKDLDVKGAGFTAKRGTLVKNIRLTDNPKHIEGKVNGTMIVLVAAYLKKV